MTRLISAVRWEQKLQWRNGFYYASLFVGLVTMAFMLMVDLPRLDLLLPALVFFNIVTGTFYFVSGIVLLEKAERVLEGLVITPLRDFEYVSAKVITLVGLALLETLLVVGVVAVAKSMPFSLLWTVLGTILLGTMYVLVGFIFVTRYDSINEFLLPSVLVTMLFAFPMLWHFGLMDSPLLYLHPMQAPTVLLRAGFMPVELWQLMYGAVYSLLWIGIGFVLARRAFVNFVVLQKGSRRRRRATA